jgi:uncharacterized protein (DUF1697 family)
MKYLALLRGINVGGNCKVEMKRLRSLFEGLGFENVVTYINSGNVVFESDLDVNGLVEMIEVAILVEFGFGVKTLVRSSENILKLVESIPEKWRNDIDQKCDVLFLWDEFDSVDTLKLILQNPDVDTLIYRAGAIIWHVDRTYYKLSGMRKFVGTKVYKGMTARNVNTVRKLAQMLI